MNERLGTVIDASLERGIDVRLDPTVSVEDMVVGRYVTITGKKRRFFGMITDVRLGLTDERISLEPADFADPFMAEVLNGTSTYGIIHVTPMLTIGGQETLLEGPQPVKTIPGHFTPVQLATEQDMNIVFGDESEQRFNIGNPLDMETKLCLDLEEFARRSNGIFGKSGTGKTFLTRILLIGMLQKSKTVNLIFDMHNEYGWKGTFEGKTSATVKGLKQLFPEKVAVFTLDEESSRRRKVKTDFVVKIGYNEITPEDIAILRSTLNLTDLAVEAAYQLRRSLGKNWIQQVLTRSEDEMEELLKGASIHESSFQSLKRGLGIIGRLGFVVPEAKEDAVNSILNFLQAGKNVVLEFGRYQEISAYLLVANLLSRRIYSRYQQQTEEATASDNEAQKPRPLVITIEEAHKFLNPEVSGKTIFGTIAREMRKYNVSLLVIDQRPSGIDEEIMSQLGTKITCLLDNEKDIDAVLAGVSGKNELKAVLARLAPRQQALIFGHAVPMPVAFQPREYGSAESYRALTGGRDELSLAEIQKDIEDLFD